MTDGTRREIRSRPDPPRTGEGDVARSRAAGFPVARFGPPAIERKDAAA
jgi:hypothetical protein